MKGNFSKKDVRLNAFLIPLPLRERVPEGRVRGVSGGGIRNYEKRIITIS